MIEPSRVCFSRQALFDYYATSFDESLKGLDYSSPEALREVLGGMKPRYSEVFDAGCGTGLLGPLFRDISGMNICAARLRCALGRGFW